MHIERKNIVVDHENLSPSYLKMKEEGTSERGGKYGMRREVRKGERSSGEDSSHKSLFSHLLPFTPRIWHGKGNMT